MTSRQTQSVRQIVWADGAFGREDLGLSRQVEFFPIRAQIVREIENIGELVFFVEQNPQMIAADAVRNHHQRIHVLSAQTVRPGEESVLVRVDNFVGVCDRLVMQVDIDREPFARCVIRYRKHPDQMIRCLARKVALELRRRHHVGAELAALFYGQRYDADLVVFYRVLAPNVAAVHEPDKRPLGQLRRIANPFLRDPQQPLVAGKFDKGKCHNLRSN